jgi:hypothetical protein
LIKILRESTGVRPLQSTSPHSTCSPLTVTISPSDGQVLVLGLPPPSLIRIFSVHGGQSLMTSP